MFAASPSLMGIASALAEVVAQLVLFAIVWIAGGWLFNKLCYFTGWVFSGGMRFWAKSSEGSTYLQEDLRERGKNFFMGLGFVAVASVFVVLVCVDGFKGAQHGTASFLVVLVVGGCVFGLLFLAGVCGILVSILQGYVGVSEKGVAQFGPLGFRIKKLDWDEIATISTDISNPNADYEVRSNSGTTISVGASLPGIELFIAACRLHLSGRVCLTALETPASIAESVG